MDARCVLLAICVASSSTGTNISAQQDANARARQAYSRAIELETRGDHAAALSLLWEAGGLAPGDADIQNSLGEALERLGALDAAIEAYRRAITERPGFEKAANNLILTLVKAGRGPEALERARAIAAAAPNDPNRLFTIGLAQSEQDPAEAIKTFRRVLQLAPRHTLARYNLALVLQHEDRLQEAVEELGRAIETEPRAQAQYALGIIYWHQGQLDRAAAALRAAIALDPRLAAAHHTLGAVLKDRRDWTGAAESLRRAIALDPRLAGAFFTLAQVLRLAGDEAGSRHVLADADRLRQRTESEQKALMWTSVGAQKLDAGDLVGALDQFRRAVAAYEPYAPAHYQMGRALQRLGESEASRAAFARAQQLNPSLVPPGR